MNFLDIINSAYFSNSAFQSDIVLKVRQPSKEEAPKFKEGGTLYSFLYPAQNKDLIDELAKQKITAFGMDCVPRISRAQVFDALSSMGNISGKCSYAFNIGGPKFQKLFLALFVFYWGDPKPTWTIV